MKSILNLWWVVLIKGIILVLLSFFVFKHPVGSLVGLALYLGIALLITGIGLIITSIAHSKADENWGWQLSGGIIDVIFALVFLSNPGITAAIFPFIVGFWMMIYGVILFSGSFKDKKEGDSNWWLKLLGGILTVILGYFITANLLAGAVALTLWIGLGILIFGIINISVSFGMRKVKKAID